MRWATFVAPGDARARAGLVIDDEVRALAPATDLLSLLGDDGSILRDAARRAERSPDFVSPLAAVQLRAPIPRPPSVRDFYAFEQHVRTARERRGLEMEPDWYELPVFYFSNPASIVGPGEPVARPASTQLLDFELEIAAVIDGDGEIGGFVLMNDWSARDVQLGEMAVGLGPAKAKDFATSLGPYLVTPDELPYSEGRLTLEARVHVNGEELSRCHAEEMHFTWPEIVAHAARDTRLRAGDVLGSGTLTGGCLIELGPLPGDRFLEPGDTVALMAGALGRLENEVV
jgi:2-keto-4-pentenoate hydratase/2-oxohepta-3-ene-1,7-dioic acid hydratase in catechol pathway